MKIMTILGPVDRENLEDRDRVTFTDDARQVVTEWHLHGVLVRRDVWTNSLMSPETLGVEKPSAAELIGMAETFAKENPDIVRGIVVLQGGLKP